jgi:hypothetical protein
MRMAMSLPAPSENIGDVSASLAKSSVMRKA